MRKIGLSIIGICFLLILGACSNNETKTVDIKQLVNEYSVGSFEEVSASISSHELIVTEEDENVTTYELPEEEFFVSIAPYVEKTHPCAIHSLTGCQGELVEQEFYVYIEDEDGNVVVDETITSLENGFIDLWLPRDQTFQVKIEYDGKETKSEISTFEGDNTCITTMQLL
mgnify:CR=1 FL=1